MFAIGEKRATRIVMALCTIALVACAFNGTRVALTCLAAILVVAFLGDLF